ncbi:uncharacterized protein LOC135469839 [Liolophura sinensis]|uniref:uncharacterized protein LOC135469839 n=1 Tax=Liolophura sinensis TaxID=3198878 RepID=UPI0031599580
MRFEVPALADLSLRLVAQALVCDKEEGITTIFEYLINLLKTQAFTSVTETILSHLVKCHASYLSDTCIQVLCPSHLKQLSFRECNQLTWPGVKEVLSRLNSLQIVNLSFCDQLMSPDLDLTIEVHLSSTLTCVAMEECSSLTDNIVQHLLGQAKSLRNLNISSCDNISDKVFLLNEELQLSREALGRSSVEYPCRLTSVDVSGCRSLTSTVVRHLATLTGPTLRSVNLSCVQVDCMALLYLCGYGLVSAVSLMFGEENGQGLIQDKDLTENLLELQLLQARRFQYSTCEQDRQNVKMLPSVGGETHHTTSAVTEWDLRNPLRNLECRQEAPIEHHIPTDSVGECANMTTAKIRYQQKNVITEESEDSTLKRTDYVILDNGCDIAMALEAYSSDSICIEELENSESGFVDATKTSGTRFLKSCNQIGEEKGSFKSEADDITSPSNECSWNLQISHNADESADFLLSAKFCPEAKTVVQNFSCPLAENACPIAAFLPSNSDISATNVNSDISAMNVKSDISVMNMKSDVLGMNVNSEISVANVNDDISAMNVYDDVSAMNVNSDISAMNLNGDVSTVNMNSDISAMNDNSDVSANQTNCDTLDNKI